MEYSMTIEPLCILSHDDEDGQYKPTDSSPTYNTFDMNIDQSGYYPGDPNCGAAVNHSYAAGDAQTFKMEPLSDGSDCEEATSHVKRTNIVITSFICDRCKQIFGSEKILCEHHSQCKVNPRTLAGNMNINDPRKLWKKQFKPARPRKIIECEICQKRFRQIADLNNHMRSHTGEKPFVCEICQRTFSQQSNLKVHMRVHSEERPFECDVCDRRFTQMTHKIMHMKSHTVEKPHECEVCKKTFAHVSAKITHMKCHTGEKPNKCDSCDKGFTTVGSLRRHQKVHSAEVNVLSQLSDLIVTKVETQSGE